jgi:DNA-binding winged helix-turn-helix (wHTH) protein
MMLDVAAYELRRNGHRIRLERQPMDLLILLVGRPGQLVSRSEIVDALWAKDVFVDVENSSSFIAQPVLIPPIQSRGRTLRWRTVRAR